MPTDVREQASHVAQSCETGRFVGKKRCNPPIEQIAVLDETAKSTPFLTRGADQRIFGALARVELAVEQPLTPSESGDDNRFETQTPKHGREQIGRAPRREGGWNYGKDQGV